MEIKEVNSNVTQKGFLLGQLKIHFLSNKFPWSRFTSLNGSLKSQWQQSIHHCDWNIYVL